VAYFVFVRERTSSFEDRVAQDRLEIRDAVFQLWTTLPQGTASLLPPTFSDAYRAAYPGKGRAEIVSQAATDLVFSAPVIDKVFEETRRVDTFGGPSSGRLYLWVLSQALTVMTPGTVEMPTKPDGVFPAIPTELGFDAWRRDFEKVRGALLLLSQFNDQLQADFQKFLNQNQVRHPNLTILGPLAKQGVARLFQNVNSIQTLLSDIDKQRLLGSQYSFNGFWLSIWLVVAFLSGVIFPLGLLV